MSVLAVFVSRAVCGSNSQSERIGDNQLGEGPVRMFHARDFKGPGILLLVLKKFVFVSGWSASYFDEELNEASLSAQRLKPVAKVSPVPCKPRMELVFTGIESDSIGSMQRHVRNFLSCRLGFFFIFLPTQRDVPR